MPAQKTKLFPTVSRELLEALEQRFHDRLPQAGTDLREIDRRIGNVEVLRFLRREFNRQNGNPLE